MIHTMYETPGTCPIVYIIYHSEDSQVSLQVVEKPNRCTKFFVRFAVHRLAKFGWVSFARLRLRSLAMKWNAELTEDKPIGKYDGRILSGLWTKVHDILTM